MSFRNARRQMSNQVARTERNQMKLQRLRDQVRQSTNAFMARQHARLAWWQSAFRTPTLVSRFVSGFNSLWMAFLGLLGLSPRTQRNNVRGNVPGKVFLRGLLVEGLEQRQLMAVDVFANDTTVYEDIPGGTLATNGQFLLKGVVANEVLVFKLDGTANSEFGIDYNLKVNGTGVASTPVPNTVTFTVPAAFPGTVIAVNIEAIDDNLYDGGDESVNLTLISASVGGVGTAAGTMKIVDNELRHGVSGIVRR